MLSAICAHVQNGLRLALGIACSVLVSVEMHLL
jgi:hypothetical protein